MIFDMKQFITLLLLSCCIGMFAGCAPKTVKDIPTQQRLEIPSKRVPPQLKVPATQRPYKIKGRTYFPIPSAYGFVETGTASWYGRKFHGRKTANGEIYNMHALTAAHRTLPMNTWLLVTNLTNNKTVTVRINDRGPFARGRILDLSYAAAKQIRMVEPGTARVKITALGETRQYRRGGKIVNRFLPHQNFKAGRFYVQIGSFTDRGNAIRLTKQMTRWGRETVIHQHNRGGQLIHRVRVKAGTILASAFRMERILHKAGYPDAFVVAE